MVSSLGLLTVEAGGSLSSSTNGELREEKESITSPPYVSSKLVAFVRSSLEELVAVTAGTSLVVEPLA